MVLGLLAIGIGQQISQRQQAEREHAEAERIAQQDEREQQEQERDKQEKERLAAEAARQQTQKFEQVEQEFADRFLHQLLANKEISAEDARQHALKELPGLVKLPLEEIQTIINRCLNRGARG